MTTTVWAPGTGGGTLVSDSGHYTLGNQFATCQSVVLTGIWFYSPSGAVVLPSQCVIFNRDSTQVAGTLKTSPSWSGAAGSGWVKCSYDGTVTLPWGSYVVAVLGGGSNWYSSTSAYWSTGPGGNDNGQSNNPLSMEPYNFTDHANQSVVNSGSTLVFPTGGGSTGNNNWIDVEVAPDADAPHYTLMTAALPPDPAGSDINTAATVGMQFGVSRDCTLTAIWQLAAASDALPVHVGIYQITSPGSGTLVVDNSSPTWAGPGIYAWNRCAMPPTQLSAGTNYVVASFEGGTKNWLPIGGSFWTSGHGSLGLNNGPLFAPNNANSVNGQGVISTTTGSFTFPNSSPGDGTQYFVDVEVIEPAEPFTILRRQYLTDVAQTDTSHLTIGTQFSVTSEVNLTGIWWFSPPSAASLPSACVIYDLGASSQVSGTLNSSATWSGSAASGWVKCSYNGTVTLVPGKNYEVCVLGGGSKWYALQSHWWDTTGPGASGMTNGPLTAPNSASSVNGQSATAAGSSLQIPTTALNASNYFVDVEVSPLRGLVVSFP